MKIIETAGGQNKGIRGQVREVPEIVRVAGGYAGSLANGYKDEASPVGIDIFLLCNYYNDIPADRIFF